MFYQPAQRVSGSTIKQHRSCFSLPPPPPPLPHPKHTPTIHRWQARTHARRYTNTHAHPTALCVCVCVSVRERERGDQNNHPAQSMNDQLEGSQSLGPITPGPPVRRTIKTDPKTSAWLHPPTSLCFNLPVKLECT